jgi:hypothetical protein
MIGVIGAGACSLAIEELAAEVGREIAHSGGIVICGGLGGVMTAAARGAKEGGGYTVGILPGASIFDANAYIDFPIATNMGHARNAIIAQTAEALIAVAGGYGTLSEIALGLKMGKGVVALACELTIPGARLAADAREAVREALTFTRTSAARTIMV